MGSTFQNFPNLKLKPGFTVGSDALTSIINSSYKWTESGSGTNEYYLELAGGGDPGISEPANVVEDGTQMTEGTAGSLSAGEYDYGDNDTLGYDTVYVRLTTGGPDPDDLDDDKLQYSATDAINIAVQFFDRENGNEIAEAVAVLWYLSSDSAGQTIPSAPDGGIAIGTDGTLIEWTANLSGLAISEADGDLDVNITESGNNSFYLNLIMPDGRRYASSVADFN